jgi:carbamoyl-phosphate synthase large subunit
MGFSDKRLGKLTDTDADAVMAKRRKLGVRPVFKRIDTCAAEFASPTAYMYSTYEAPFAGKVVDEAAPSDRKKVVILGGGPNRIGQGIEFDYCCCHAAFALKEVGYETIMVNCNPETVSTDYDTSDRLYFEPLTPEDVLEIIDTERSNGTLHGVIVQFGGQTPLKLAEPLEKAKVPILGTSSMRSILPRTAIASRSCSTSSSCASRRMALRPRRTPPARSRKRSGIQSSSARHTCWAAAPWKLCVMARSSIATSRALRADLDRPTELVVSEKSPLLIDSYLSDATEVDVDCLVRRQGYLHRRHHGAHRGGRHSLRRLRLRPSAPFAGGEDHRRTRTPDPRMALALNVGGLMNVQYAIKDGEIYVLEVNPRASRPCRSLPRSSASDRKDRGPDHGRRKLKDFDLKSTRPQHRAVKEAVFPFARFPGVDTVLGPEMKSTGEVMGIDGSFEIAFAKSQIGGGTSLPRSGTVFVSVKDADKARILPAVKLLASLGFKTIATSGTQRYLAEQGVEAAKINKVLEGRPHIVDAIKNGGVQLVFNTTEGAAALADSRSLRHAALLHKVPYYTTLSGAVAAAQGIKAYLEGDLEVHALQSYFGGRG